MKQGGTQNKGGSVIIIWNGIILGEREGYGTFLC